jgi:hypothetical protein
MAIDDNKSYELTGYQVKDLASKVRAKADSSALASVATSGLYSDLTGRPTIPTVNNGTLTIKQNGTTVDTFAANQATGTTVDIDIHNGVLTADNLSPTADTTAAWGTLLGEEGVYWTFYSQSGCFTNQPSQWGYLETILHRTTDLSGWEIYQRWHVQAAGNEYYRSGNAIGWYSNANYSGGFRRIVDSTVTRVTITNSSSVSSASLKCRQDGSMLTIYGSFYVSAAIAGNGVVATLSDETLLDVDGVTTGGNQYSVNAFDKNGKVFRLYLKQNGANVDIVVDSVTLATGWYSLSGVATVVSYNLG